jgi:signal recognition particle subunit SRP54
MLENITKKFDLLLKKIQGRGVLTEQNIDETLREVRLALLGADVHFSVVKSFIENVRKSAVGTEVLESLAPGQQMVKIVWLELSRLMGPQNTGIAFNTTPTKVMLVGLQGTGKTTSAAKLALFYKRQGKKVLLVATDLKRPAACEQLHTLAKGIDVPIVLPNGKTDLLSVVAAGLEAGQAQGVDLLIFDTAGRIEADEALMKELADIRSWVAPEEVLLVADAMTGQSAVQVAERFHQSIGVSGVILTKTEGDARGGAMLSVRAVTGAPIRFMGIGEKVEALELFHPDRMASRILGMGDILSLVEQVEKKFSKEQACHVAEKIKSDQFTLEDFLQQLVQIRGMGDIGEILNMIPGVRGMAKLPDSGQMDKELRHSTAILSSMTLKERRDPDSINGSCRVRIAKGSGTSVQEVNRLLKQFFQAKKMLKSVSTGKGQKFGGLGGGWKNPLRQIFSS